MRPVLFEIPGLNIPIFAYGFMIMVGFLVGIFIATRRAKKAGTDPNNILDLGIYLVVFGVLGARLFFVIQFRNKFGFQILNIFDGNLSIIGILAGLALGAILYFYRKKLQFLKRFHNDTVNTKVFFAVLAIILAIIAGRAGYVAATPSSTKIVAVVQKRSDFYADSFRSELVSKYDKRVTRIVGRLLGSGESIGKEKVQAYVFLPAHDKTGRSGFTYEGAKDWLLQHSVVYEELRPAYDLMLFEIWKGGLVYYGGVIGAVAAALLFAFRRKVSFWGLADICAPSIAAGLACGRIGCFLNGCCWGKIAETFPLSLTFPPGSPAFNQHLSMGEITAAAECSLPVYPTQLAAALFAIGLAVVVWLFGRSRLKRRMGEEILLLGMLYPWIRFVLEAYRGDNEPSYLFGSLTISQSVGLFVFAGCLGVFVLRRLKGWGKIAEPEPAGENAQNNRK